MLHPTITAPNTPRIRHVMNISLKIDFTMRPAVCIYALRSSPDGLQFICIIIFKLPQESIPLVISNSIIRAAFASIIAPHSDIND